jgi:hypothetical protein
MTKLRASAPFPRSVLAAGIRRGLLAGAAVAAMTFPLAARSDLPDMPDLESTRVSAPAARVADFGKKQASPEARYLANWVAHSGDNAGGGFIIVDKKHATVYVFDADARLRGSSPVLLGGARGDDSVPGIGSRPLAQVRPQERTTPAGRFVAERGRNARGEDVVWVDYEASVSMHRVLTTNPKERRLERLATPRVDDNRISYGCINVPVAFFETYVRPVFAVHRAMVYILPEVRSVRQVFGPKEAVAHVDVEG